MSRVRHLAPLNLDHAKQLFFTDINKSPQFTYAQPVDSAELRHWGEPQPAFVQLATQILAKRPNLISHRQVVPPATISTQVQQLISQVGVTEPISIEFDAQKLTRCSVHGQRIIFRDPPEFESTAELSATLNHEVQTHLWRNLNQKKQGWQLDRFRNDHLLLRTEEGLAVLHSAMVMPDPLLWRAAAYYLAVAWGTELGFSQLFQQLRQYGFDSQFAWRLSARVKRGLTDTSQPGGNSKDLCYLEGAVQMWRWLIQPEHDPRHLYVGKVYLEELEEKLSQVTTTQVYRPTFLADLESYRHQLARVGERNGFVPLPSQERHE